MNIDCRVYVLDYFRNNPPANPMNDERTFLGKVWGILFLSTMPVVSVLSVV